MFASLSKEGFFQYLKLKNILGLRAGVNPHIAAVKTEWTKYGDVLEAVQKKLHQASETIEKAKVRSRAVERKLKDVQELPVGEAASLLPPNVMEDDIGAGEGDRICVD